VSTLLIDSCLLPPPPLPRFATPGIRNSITSKAEVAMSWSSPAEMIISAAVFLAAPSVKPGGQQQQHATFFFVVVSDLECLTLERLQCLDSLRDLRRTAAPALMESASFTGIEGPQLQSSRCAVLGTGGRCLLRA
jgi:hypothetical protein